MKTRILALAAAVALIGSIRTQAINLDISTIDFGATGAGLRFVGGAGDNDTFTFLNNPSGFTFVVALSSGAAGDSLGLPGTVTGTFTIGPVTVSGGVQTAPVTSSPGAKLSIIDGAATFSGFIDWVQIMTIGTADFLNSGGVINLTGLTYNGTKADLLALASAPGAEATLQFGFVPARSLMDLKTDGQTNFTTFTGDILATNVPSCNCSLVCAPDKTIECSEPLTFNAPTRTGICSNTPFSSITTVTNISGCTSIVTRTWQLVDSCNITSRCSQVITVRDTLKPTITSCPQGTNFGCNPTSLPTCDTVKALIAASDNCHVKQTNCAVADSDSGCLHTRTFTIRAEDDCGNLSDPCLVTYTWTIDTKKPTVSGVPSGGDLGCTPASIPSDDDIRSQLTVGDSCGGRINLTITHVDTGTACGTSNRTFTITASDTCGNTFVTNVVYSYGCGVSTCIPGKFTFTGSSSDDGPDGNYRKFTANGVTVKVWAFSRTKDTGTWAPAYLGLYSKGLGVTDSSESGTEPTHAVDNVGRDNFLLFEFSQPVVVDKAFLGWVDTDSDLNAWIGTFPDPFNNHLTLSDGVLGSFAFTEENLGSSSTRTADLNSGQLVGNALVIAAHAYNSSGQRITDTKDQFKVNTLEFCKPDCSPPPPPPCNSGEFTFSGSGPSVGSPNIRTFIANNGVMVNVSGFSRSSPTWASAYVGLYSKGLGVTDTSEDGSDPSHAVDNVGRTNYLLFEFSQKVVMDKVYLGFVDTDSDLTVWIGNIPDAFNSHTTLSDAVLSGLGFTEENLGGSSTRWADLNSGSVAGNVVVIAASAKNADKYKDQFKVNLLDFCVQDPVPALQSPWASKDIGSVGAVGGANVVNGKFNVLGSGEDIWSDEDGFRYVYQLASGDCTIKAQVTGIQNTDAWAKAGVMIRESLSDDAKHASAVITPGSGVAFLVRSSSGGSTVDVNNPPGTVPKWLRVVRSGSTFTAAYSDDNVTWNPLGSRTISMNTTVYIGLAVTSHNNGTTCFATFENVTASP